MTDTTEAVSVRTRRPALVTGTVVAGVLLAQSVVLSIYGFVFQGVAFGGVQFSPTGAPQLLFGILGALVALIIRCAAFGAGVFVSLRFIRPIGPDDGWRRVVTRGIVAALVGAAALLVLAIVESLLTAFNPGQYPFGYSFQPGLDPGAITRGLTGAFATVLNPLVNWFPLVLLAVAGQRVWWGKRS